MAIEIVDSRWREGLQAPALAKQADSLCHGALVLGPWVAFDARRDWSHQAGQVRIGAQPAHRFAGTHSLADPSWLLPAWLRHATRHGALPADSVVTTGSWCGLLHARAGDAVEVVFDGLPSARVQL